MLSPVGCFKEKAHPRASEFWRFPIAPLNLDL
jgi:hypothetical protein